MSHSEQLKFINFNLPIIINNCNCHDDGDNNRDRKRKEEFVKTYK